MNGLLLVEGLNHGRLILTRTSIKMFQLYHGEQHISVSRSYFVREFMNLAKDDTTLAACSNIDGSSEMSPSPLATMYISCMKEEESKSSCLPLLTKCYIGLRASQIETHLNII